MNAAGRLRDRARRTEGGGVGALVLAVTAFSWGFVIVKGVDLPGPQIAAMRLAIGAVTIAAVAAAIGERVTRLTLPVAGAGIAFGLHQLLFIEATKRTSIAIVTLVAALQPLVVSAVSRRALGEAVPRRLVACAGLAVAGVAIVVAANLGDASRSLAGDLLSVVNLFMFTAYFLFAKAARGRGAHTLTLTASVFTIGFLVQIPALVVVGVSASGGLRLPGVGEFGLLVVLALVPGNGHLLLNWAHGRVSAALGSLVLALVPILASLWAALVFGEPYGWRHLAGMILVVAAVDGGRRAERSRRADAAVMPPVE